MELTDILYQPYIISIVIALIFTFIVYIILKRNNTDKKNAQQSYSKTLTITFFCSFIVFLGLIYGMRHLSNTKMEIMYGGGNSGISVSDLSDKLNISGNDVDFGLLDN